MTKFNLGAGILAVALALPAAGQDGDTTFAFSAAQKSPTYAIEIFGSDVTLEWRDESGRRSADSEPRLQLTVTGGAGIAAERIGELTLSLNGAVLAGRMRSSDLFLVGDDGQPDLGALSVDIVDGGDAGQSFVTFEVVVVDALEAEDVLQIALPELEVSGAWMTGRGTSGAGVRASLRSESLELRRAGASNADFFPDAVSCTGEALEMGANLMTDSQCRTLGAQGPLWGGVEVVPAAQSALPIGSDEVDRTGTIRIDERGTVEGLSALRTVLLNWVGTVATVQPNADRPAATDLRQADGSSWGIGARQDGVGELVIDVMGSLVPDSDRIVYDANANEELDAADPSVTVTQDENGLASAQLRVPLGDAGVDARPKAIWYVPGDSSALRPGTFQSRVWIDYALGSARDTPPDVADTRTGYVVHTLSYNGDASNAYAISAPGNEAGAESNVRVKCESFQACTVYFACDDEAGGDFYGSDPIVIDGFATEVLNSQALVDDVFGGEAWSGRLSCEVVATAGIITTQNLTRQGGTLINNTYIEQ